jgi:PAS domain S-box-containing protein
MSADGHQLLDLLPDGILQLDADRRIEYANAAAASITRFKPQELAGRRAAELLEPRGRDGHPLWMDGWHPSVRLRNVRAIPEQEVTLTRADGTDVVTLIAGTYQRDEAGQLTGCVLVLREAGRRSHQASGIEIVSTVSHELRSPLTSVKGYTSLLLNRWDRLSDDQKRMMLAQVNHDADRVTRLITELLDISRLETGRLVLRRQMVDLPKLTGQVLEKVHMEYPELEASVRFPDGFPRLYADSDKVEQVLTNLVENACKYASPTGIEIVGTADEGEVALSVSDVGEGIPEADLPKVFTKFFRRDLGKPTGSGLGLWISRGLVEAHGGRLVATSIQGQGSSFRFTLPLVDFEELFGP